MSATTTLLTTQDALLAAIRDEPDDDFPRLVYADWLDENGQAERAEFIRKQIAGIPSAYAWRRWPDSLSSLIEAEGRPEDEGWRSWTWSRGFIDTIECALCCWLANDAGKKILRAHPVRRVVIWDKRPESVELGGGHLRETWLEGNAGYEGGSRRHLPTVIWRLIGPVYHPCLDDAMEALYAAALLWAKPKT